GGWSIYDPAFAPEQTQFRVVDENGKKVALWKGKSGKARRAEVTQDRTGKWIARGTNTQNQRREGEVVTDRDGPDRRVLTGSTLVLAGEYTRMQDTFANLGVGLILASLLIYFLMVALDRSFIVPLAVMLIVPLCLIGILPMLFVTGSAINVQSLLGFIF